MAITPCDKIKLSRIKNMKPISNNIGKYVVSNNGEIQYIDANDLNTYFNSSNIVSEFKILSMNDNNITFSSGNVVTSKINNKNYTLQLNGDSLDTSISFENGGCADKLLMKQWQQPRLSFNNSSSIMSVGSENYITNFDAWKAFDGNNDEKNYWCSAKSSLPVWLKIDLTYPLVINKFAIQNKNDISDDGNLIAFKILGLDISDNWDILVDIDNINNKVKYIQNNYWNEYEVESNKLYKSIKIVCNNTLGDSFATIGRFEIIGNYQGYRLPLTHYNVFAIGKESYDTDAKIIVSADEEPKLPNDYSYSVKLGCYETDINNKTSYFYPKQCVSEAFIKGFIISENNNPNLGYRVYSDGWKVQWGTNANPIFPIAFDYTPTIVERGATNVTRTGMTIKAQKWKVEGY